MHREEAENYLHQKVESGEIVSPVLPEGIKNYLIDIDGTICDDIPNEEPERMATAKIYPDALETLNKWFDEGHLICFFTSRVESHREVTEKWLKEKKFNGIHVEKKYFDRNGNIYIREDLISYKKIEKFLTIPENCDNIN